VTDQPITHLLVLVEGEVYLHTGRTWFPNGVIADGHGMVHVHDRWYRPDDAIALAASIVSAALKERN